MSLTDGESGTITPTMVNSGDTTTISYESSDTSVATVDSEGVVTAVGAGTATITVSTASCSKEVTVTVTLLEDGNEERPYLISSVEEYKSKLVDNNVAGYYYEVTADLDFSTVTDYTTSYTVSGFQGNIDFKEHTVEGCTLDVFYVLRSDAYNNDSLTGIFSYSGLFDKTSNATINNLNYAMHELGSDNSVRPVLRVSGTTTFENVNVRGSVTYSDNNCSAFVWSVTYSTSDNPTTLTFKNCTNYANIHNSGGNAAAFLGSISNSANANGDYTTNVNLVFDNCVNYGDIYSAGNVAILISNAPALTATLMRTSA